MKVNVLVTVDVESTTEPYEPKTIYQENILRDSAVKTVRTLIFEREEDIRNTKVAKIRVLAIDLL